MTRPRDGRGFAPRYDFDTLKRVSRARFSAVRTPLPRRWPDLSLFLFLSLFPFTFTFPFAFNPSGGGVISEPVEARDPASAAFETTVGAAHVVTQTICTKARVRRLSGKPLTFAAFSGRFAVE